MKFPELVAPAGTFETLDAALVHGADAVYVGIGRHNLRTNAPFFYPDELPDALDRTREAGAKLYGVINSMPGNEQLEEIATLLDCIAKLPEAPDALVVSDPGVITECRRRVPSIPLHLSTQSGVFNSSSLKFWSEQKIRRVVLPRELSLDKIRSLNDENTVSTEVFVHGAMCVSISGRCLLGAYMWGRHPNQGDCPQPCRFAYTIVPKDGGESAGSGFDIEENETGTYIMNSKDLNTLAILDKVVDSGVSALKIEGRNKSGHYVASVVRTYRLALDRIKALDGKPYEPDPEWITELERLDHRPYTTGFYLDEYAMQAPQSAKAPQQVRLVGRVRAELPENKYVVDVKNPFTPNELLNVLPSSRNRRQHNLAFRKITDLAGHELQRALTNRLVIVEERGGKLQIGDMLRRSAIEIDHGDDEGWMP